MDVGPVSGLSLPVLTPLYGFSEISSPELEVKTKEIEQANAYYSVTVAQGGKAGRITLKRGASFGDSEFYRWVISTITGDPGANPSTAMLGLGTPIFLRRTLVLVQFFPRRPDLDSAVSGTVGTGLAAALLGSILPAPLEGGIRLPARAWVLRGCLPTKYRAADGFSGTDGGITVMELEVAPERMEEINLGA